MRGAFIREEDYKIVSLADYPEILDAVNQLGDDSWPAFMHHDPVAKRYWPRLYTDFADCQFAIIDTYNGALIAAGHSLALRWDDPIGDLPDDGWDGIVKRAFADFDAGREPNAQCALAIAIAQKYRGHGLSTVMVEAMREIGQRQGLKWLLAPLRPTLKTLYPLIPMSRYILWEREDGQPFDPWIRVHARIGAEIVKVCTQSMTITGTVADWERWTGLKFPDSGVYVIPGALSPIEIDVERDLGTYIEPNVWMVHELTAEAPKRAADGE
jgi:GNAT superfamily N-acetyltransferase